MPALCSVLRRRSPLVFPSALVRASPVPSFVQNPHSSPRCVCTLPRTTLAISALLLRLSPQRGPSAFHRAAPALSPYFALLRQFSSLRYTGARLPTATALFFALRWRYYFSLLVGSITLRQWYSSCCDGAVFLASPAVCFVLRWRYRFCIAGAIFGTTPVRQER